MEDNQQHIEAFFQQRLGIPLSALLAPIEGDKPEGRSLRGNGVYSAIKEARREDDPTLPLGEWEYELKRADWDKVSKVALDAIANKSKDLQLAAWLLEAEIHRQGFAGVAACTILLQELCENYWDGLYPKIEDEDLEYRTNIIAWANEKLIPLLRIQPITTEINQRTYSWDDWDQAKRNDQLRSAKGISEDELSNKITPAEVFAALAATSTDDHSELYYTLADALFSIQSLEDTLNTLCGDDAPSLRNISGLLEDIQTMIAAELHKRGVRLNSGAAVDEDDAGSQSGDGGSFGGGDDGGAIRDRAHAYARLAEAADYLMHIEPHSPAPYLVKRAIEWGNLNTAELYHQLFVQFQGQLNIFELLGVTDTRENNE